MMRRTILMLGAMSLVVVALIVAVRVYESTKFIDEEVTSGEGWGVAIGDSTSEVLAKLKSRYSERAAALVVYREEPPKSEVIDRLSDARATQLDGASKIVVLGTEAAVSELTVEFVGGRAARIHMRQRAFDL